MIEYFFVPVLNGLKFVSELNPSSWDADFFIETTPEGFSQVDYCQKVNRNETRKIQFQSTEPDNWVVQVEDRNGVVIDSITPSIVWTPTGVNWVQFEAEIVTPFQTDGYYRVFIRQVVFTGAALLDDLNAPLLDNLGEELLDDSPAVPVVDTFATSEWIDVRLEHPNTELLQFSNEYNDENLYFEGGFTANLRAECHIYKRVPASERSAFRNTAGKLKVLSSRTRRRRVLEFKNLPPYLHEQISIGLSLTTVRLNESVYASEEGLSEPEYKSALFLLSNSSAVVEDITGFDPEQNPPLDPIFPIATENNDDIITETNDTIVYKF